MSDNDKPRRASVPMIVFSATITVYFLYVLFFAQGPAQSPLLTGLYAIAVIANLVFLASVVFGRR